jgi:hypothetical protein
MLEGDYECEYCHEPFQKRRYHINDGESNMYFCLPECLVGYDWYVQGTNTESEEERQFAIEQYKFTFKRHVVPAPLSVYMRNDTRKREEWLFSTCRNHLNRADAAQAQLELKD